MPTMTPTLSTRNPTEATTPPTSKPTTGTPTVSTDMPTQDTNSPTMNTEIPSAIPSMTPTKSPTSTPSMTPTESPTMCPYYRNDYNLETFPFSPIYEYNITSNNSLYYKYDLTAPELPYYINCTNTGQCEIVCDQVIACYDSVMIGANVTESVSIKCNFEVSCGEADVLMYPNYDMDVNDNSYTAAIYCTAKESCGGMGIFCIFCIFFYQKHIFITHRYAI